MQASLVPLGFDRMSAEAQLCALDLLAEARHLAMTFRPGSVLPPPGRCPLGAHVFFAGFGDPKPTGWEASKATGGIYGYPHDAPCRVDGGSTTHHLWSEPCSEPCEVSPRRRSVQNRRARSPQEPQEPSPNPSLLKSSRLGAEAEEKVQKRLHFEA